MTTTSSKHAGAVLFDPDAVPDEHRVRSHVEIRALLNEFIGGDLPLSLAIPHGETYISSLWAEDPHKGLVVFAADPRHEVVARLTEATNVVVTGYLDSVKVQFVVHDLMLVHGSQGSALNTRYPRELFRFQRRNAYRVRPINKAQHAQAVFAHPAVPRRAMALRILDISSLGVALLSQESLGLFSQGQVIKNVQLELDAANHLRVDLRVMHIDTIGGVTPGAGDVGVASGAAAVPQSMQLPAVKAKTASAAPSGQRLGCELLNMSSAVQRQLRLYLDDAQRFYRMMSR